MKKILYLILVLIVLFVCGCTKPVDEPVSLSYDELEIEMNVGETINVKPNIIGLKTDVYQLSYELYDDIAVIDEEGNLTALEEGIIDVVVTIDIEPSAIAQLTVTINGLAEGQYSVSLDVNGGNPLSSNMIIFSKGDNVELPVPEREGYIFMGWYDSNNKLVETIKNKNYELIAKWESLASRVQLEYVLEEGVYLSNYVTRSEIINDLIKDIQSVKGDEYTLQYFLEYEGTGHGIFAAAAGAKTLFSNDNMRAKWGWLLEYIKEQRIAKGLEVDDYDEFISKGNTLTASLSINLEMIAFICGKDFSLVSESVTCETVDYSSQEVRNGFWDTMHKYLLSNSMFKKDSMSVSLIPDALKIGSKFEGWYTSSDLSESSKVTSKTVFESNMTLYPKFNNLNNNVKLELNYDGGVSKSLYEENGKLLSTIAITGYNLTENQDSNIYICDNEKYLSSQSTVIYIAKDQFTELYKIVSINNAWIAKAEYAIVIPNALKSKVDVEKIATNDIVLFDKDITLVSSNNVCNAKIYDEIVSNDIMNQETTSDYVIPIPVRIGYTFEGWYDDYSNKYEKITDFEGLSSLSIYAIWKFNGRIIGEFDDKSWVVKGNTISLLTTFIGDNNGGLIWESENTDIATVDQVGTVKGVSEGVATIIVRSKLFSDVSFTFYVTVFDEEPTDILKLLVDSNNASVYTREHIIIGIISQPGYFYTDIVGGVSKLLFEDYVVHNDYYLANPANKSSLVAEGIEFITFHYAADMQGSAKNGGKNLAIFNRDNNLTGNQASWHYGTGNDGVWACQTEAYGAWHAGSSKAMTWHDTGIKYKETDPEFAKITLESDNYFYLNGQKTLVKNPTVGDKLNGMGLAFKVVNGNYYISGCYFNETYRYISSTGGNKNSIGIESSCAEGSDLWLTWQYSAQLCANLLLKYNLPLTKLVGHHFFSGKWCPQPMLEYDMEIWWEFIELVRQEMNYFKNYSNYDLTFSSQSEFLNDNGRINGLPIHSECVTYDITYTDGNSVKTVTLSSILPGTHNDKY